MKFKVKTTRRYLMDMDALLYEKISKLAKINKTSKRDIIEQALRKVLG